MRFQFFLAAACVTTAWALHESEAGILDWHKPLVGLPQVGSISTAPTFHRVGSEASTRSIIVTATSSNVLAALKPEDGSIVWRYIYKNEDPILIFHRQGDVIAALSGPGGATLRLFSSLKGHLLLEKRLHAPETGHLEQPAELGIAIAFLPSPGSQLRSPGDVLTLESGHTVRRIDAETGESKWNWTSPDQSSLVLYTKIIVGESTTYVIGMAKSTKSFTLHATALSSSTGEELASSNIPSSIGNWGTSDFITLSNGNDHVLAWLEQDTIKFLPLTAELKTKATYYLKNASYKRIIDVGLGGVGKFVAILPDGSSRVVGLETDGSTLKPLWDFADSAVSAVNSESDYAGGFDKDGRLYVVRTFWSHALKTAAAHVYAGHMAQGRGLLTGFTFPFDTSSHGIITHIAFDAAQIDDYKVLARLVVTTTTGTVQLWQQDKVQWTREESLASISVAQFVELPERKAIEAQSREDETFIRRITRQLLDTQNFPEYLVNFVKRFATGSYASVSSAVVPTSNNSLSRDPFGFRQIIVVVTPFGKVFALDSSNGDILWSRLFGLGWAAKVGGQVIPVKLYVIRTVADGVEPEVVVVTQRRASNTLVDTVIFHINAMTGEDARPDSDNGDILQGKDLIAGPSIHVYQMPNEHRSVVALDEFLQVYLYPETAEAKAAFAKVADSVHIALKTGQPGARQIMGHQFNLDPSLSKRYVGYPTWSAALPVEEDVVTIVSPLRGPVASIGKVLGNRTTLYKYLNPHLLAIVTRSHTVSPSKCGIYVVDTVKGSIVYDVSLPAYDGACDIKVSLAENWLVYHYFDGSLTTMGSAKGYRVVTVELYEGSSVDDKTKSSDMSSHSSDIMKLLSVEQAYVFAHGVTAVSPSSTKFGVTSKDLIVATDRKIYSIPRRLLDPRRPKRKPTTEEMEEFLVQYDPVLPDDPRRALSHNYQVANIREILTAPALLESTSLVFAYGLDLFLTRVTPSGTFDVLSETFNKTQLILIISGLTIAIMITRPMVRRKRLRERWYQ